MHSQAFSKENIHKGKSNHNLGNLGKTSLMSMLRKAYLLNSIAPAGLPLATENTSCL